MEKKPDYVNVQLENKVVCPKCKVETDRWFERFCLDIYKCEGCDHRFFWRGDAIPSDFVQKVMDYAANLLKEHQAADSPNPCYRKCYSPDASLLQAPTCTASESNTSEVPYTKIPVDCTARTLIRKVSFDILKKLDPLFPPIEGELKPYGGRSLWEACLEEVVVAVQESVVAAIPGLVRQGFQTGLDRVFPERPELPEPFEAVL